jgi:hypothetical protein
MLAFERRGRPGMDEVPVLGGESLTEDELAAVVRVVQALVDHDTDHLRPTGAYDDGGDPYLFTHHWRLWDHVDLVTPPGDPRTWIRGVVRGADNLWVALDIDMWTKQEGRSDLTLSIDLKTESDGQVTVLFRSLRVM